MGPNKGDERDADSEAYFASLPGGQQFAAATARAPPRAAGGPPSPPQDSFAGIRYTVRKLNG